MAFTGKVALVTGGGSGMGQTAARMLAEQGAKVAIFDVNEAGMAETAEGLPNVTAYAVDISDTDAVHAAVARVESELGPIDRVANAAAIMPFGKLLEQDPKVQLKLMAINYGGLVNIATATLPGMVARGQGDFISFSSMSGIIPGLLMGGYCATKGAVQMYTEILYHENRDSGVRFCCVCPPPVATPLWKQAKDTVVPKLTDASEAIAPAEVIEDVERCLDSGKFLSFPGKQTRMGYIMRRLFPNYLWNYSHKAEGF
ncbi:MAG: SDR family oxidoreductase [Gammaproteobacteria bacterium]|jgi:NAD(P)-dependent dehydrogenase (short-subunit alcohol dehydrogenase family)|nr:SDR family oxidoreductase [Gammaproteobacteria bacterium]